MYLRTEIIYRLIVLLLHLVGRLRSKGDEVPEHVGVLEVGLGVPFLRVDEAERCTRARTHKQARMRVAERARKVWGLGGTATLRHFGARSGSRMTSTSIYVLVRRPSHPTEFYGALLSGKNNKRDEIVHGNTPQQNNEMTREPPTHKYMRR